MDKKTTGIVAYITWIGLIVAFVAGDREGAKFHLNQALVIWIGSLICSVLGWVPVINWFTGILNILLWICAIVGLIGAAQGEEREVPLLGKIKILK